MAVKGDRNATTTEVPRPSGAAPLLVVLVAPGAVAFAGRELHLDGTDVLFVRVVF